MTVTTLEGAKKRLKQIKASADIYTYALGVMEVDGWFGHGNNTDGLSICQVDKDDPDVKLCLDGGPVCAGIAIDVAGQWYASARRWNKERTTALITRHLDNFLVINGQEPNNRLFRGIASFNDYDVDGYEGTKDAFGKVLKALTLEKATILRDFPTAGSWALTTVTG